MPGVYQPVSPSTPPSDPTTILESQFPAHTPLRLQFHIYSSLLSLPPGCPARPSHSETQKLKHGTESLPSCLPPAPETLTVSSGFFISGQDTSVFPVSEAGNFRPLQLHTKTESWLHVCCLLDISSSYPLCSLLATVPTGAVPSLSWTLMPSLCSPSLWTGALESVLHHTATLIALHGTYIFVFPLHYAFGWLPIVCGIKLNPCMIHYMAPACIAPQLCPALCRSHRNN